MAKLGIHEVRQVALSLLKQNDFGLEKQVLIDQIRLMHPETDIGTISTQINKLAELGIVYRPRRGHYVLNRDAGGASASSAAPKTKPNSDPTPNLLSQPSPSKFEEMALEAMSRHYGVMFHKAPGGSLIKKFDFVSDDNSIVGDAKYYTLVGGQSLPSGKFATIAEHVWLLEKTQATTRFLVFGNQKQVPEQWLARYGHLAKDVEFYFLSDGGELKRLM